MPSQKMRIDLRNDAVLVPEGLYLVEVEEVTLREAKNGSNYLNLRLLINEKDHAGAVLWMPASLRPDLLRMLRSTLRALGVMEEDLGIKTEEGEAGEALVVSPDLVGKEALAQVVHDEYMDEVQAKVKRLHPLS